MANQPHWQHHTARVNGINMHYVEAGKGPLVVLLHGFPEFWYSWRYQIPELAKHFRVVAPDMRGYNKTDKPAAVSKYKSDILSADIAALIHHLGEQKAHIVGHDWGGGVAWYITQHNPEVIDKLIIINCPPPHVLLKHITSNFKQFKKSWYILFFQLPGLPEMNMRSNLKVFFKRALRGWAYNKQAFSNDDIDKYVQAFKRHGAMRGAVNYYRAAGRGIFSKKTPFKPILNDTLVIWGENDKALGKEMTYGLDQYFQNYFEIKYIPDCSHWVQHDHPELVSRYITDFLQTNY